MDKNTFGHFLRRLRQAAGSLAAKLKKKWGGRARVYVMMLLSCALCAVLIIRLFSLQVVSGDAYTQRFEERSSRTISLSGKRGRILDRNGNVLADNKSSYDVTMTDQYTNGSAAGAKKLNAAIKKVIEAVEAGGSTMDNSFGIRLEEGGYSFSYTSLTEKNRFLADVYGYADPSDMTNQERGKTADDVVDDLAARYGIGIGKDTAADRKMRLEMIIVRYLLSLNMYQKYIPATIASDVSDDCREKIEGFIDSGEVQGLAISEDSTRVYTDGEYFSDIIGYTGKASDEELSELKKQDANYRSGDKVGMAGIEKSQESVLHGKNGSRTIKVDNMGRNIGTVGSVVKAQDGKDVYLTIDRDLQIAAYKILEKSLSEIILSKLSNVSEFRITADMKQTDIKIPMNDVYAAVMGHVLDSSHFSSDDASETEQRVAAAQETYLSSVQEALRDELSTIKTPYKKLDTEYQVYESYLVSYLYTQGIIDQSKIDTGDKTYKAWTDKETISLAEYLRYCVDKGWVNTSLLNDADSGSDAAYDALLNYCYDTVKTSSGFRTRVYRYMIINNALNKQDICQLLIDQGIVNSGSEEAAAFEAGSVTPDGFLTDRIRNLDITPAQLHLYPYSASMVITDPSNGDVLALVSYPGYDNNRIGDEEYYSDLQSDASRPMFNYATQQLTAPGSTFKMVTAAAGLTEKVITPSDIVKCTGTFTSISPSPRCWIYPGRHGNMNLQSAITNSCNFYFYEVGYRLGQNGSSGKYSTERGIKRLVKYIKAYGLDKKSGVEIEESSPTLPSTDSVRAAIGQNDQGYTTAGLAKYVTAVANSGTVYDLTLIDATADADGSNRTSGEAAKSGTVSLSDEEWDAIHDGMRGVARSKYYFSRLGNISVYGKTGTAQQGSNMPNNALFVGYTSGTDKNIAVATRIPNGYTSDYAAQITEKVMEYYYGISSLDTLTGSGSGLAGSASDD